MIRLIGILTGSALGIAVLILAFGLPELPSDPDESAIEYVVQPIEIRQAETQPVVSAQTMPVETSPPATPDTPPQEVLAETQLTAEEPPPDVPVTVPPDVPVAPPLEEPPPAERPAQNWYAFWSPFRSRIAADGFVAELQRTTGLDYRVVKLKPGIYEVAFAYTDDADIQDKLDRISAATGMDMSGG